MSAEETQVSQPVAEPSPAPAPVEAPAPAAPPPDPKDLQSVVKHAVENPTQRGKHATLQPRSESGQFAGPPKPQQAPPPAVPRPGLPKSISPKFAEHWDKIENIELLQAIAQRDADYEKGVEPLKTAKSQLDEILNEFKPYEMLMRMENATPKQAIGPLLQTAAILRTGTPGQKAHAVAQTMRQFGISLEDVQGLLQSAGPVPQQPAYDPQVMELRQQVQQLTTAQQRQQEAQVQQALAKFSANPENEFLEAVTDEMVVLLQNPQVLGQGVEVSSPEEKLKLAYDFACWKNPDVRAKLLAKQQAKEAANRQASDPARVQQAKQAAVQVSGAPSAAPAPKVNPKDLRDVVAAAFARQR